MSGKTIKILHKKRNERGIALLITLLLIVFLTLAVFNFSFTVTSNFFQMEKQQKIIRALHIAEAGINRAINDLRKDMKNQPDNPWVDGDINGYSIGPDMNEFYTFPYSDNNLNENFYTVRLKNGTYGQTMWIRSTGTVEEVEQSVEVYVEGVIASIWDNAIFADSSAPATLINGNANIHGSVHIIGSSLESGDFAIDMNGTAAIARNHYKGLSLDLRNRIPPLEQELFNGDMLDTLRSELRVKNGLVGLSGDAFVGEPDVSGNTIKETADAVYVTEGFDGNKGEENVFADNDIASPYDWGNALYLPYLDDPFEGYVTYTDYLKDNALVLTNEINIITPESNFNYTNGKGTITMDGEGHLEIDGIIFIDEGNALTVKKSGDLKTIEYSGAGSIYVSGKVNINTSLVTSGANSFPQNIIGIMTPEEINFNEAQIDVMGLFYSQDKIKIQKQTNLIGSGVSQHFDMGTNVPSIFQVPDTLFNLPPGLIGKDPFYIIKIKYWSQF